MKRTLAVMAAIVLSMPSMLPASDEIERTMVEELLRLMKVEQNIASTQELVQKMIKDQYAAIDAPEQEKEKVAKMMKRTFDLAMEEMSYDKFKDDFVAAYVKVFTQEELAGLITFYRTPVGQAFVTKMPQLSQEMMTLVQTRTRDLMPRIQALIEEAASEAGETEQDDERKED